METRFDIGAGQCRQLARLLISPGKLRDAIHFEERIIIAIGGKQNLTDLHLALLHAALDLRHRQKAAIGMQLRINAGLRLHLIQKAPDIAGVEIAIRIGGGNLPARLGLRFPNSQRRQNERRSKHIAA